LSNSAQNQALSIENENIYPWPFQKLTDMCLPYAKMQAKLEENGNFQAVFKL